jgi:hypothetical protein
MPDTINLDCFDLKPRDHFERIHIDLIHEYSDNAERVRQLWEELEEHRNPTKLLDPLRDCLPWITEDGDINNAFHNLPHHEKLERVSEAEVEAKWMLQKASDGRFSDWIEARLARAYQRLSDILKHLERTGPESTPFHGVTGTAAPQEVPDGGAVPDSMEGKANRVFEGKVRDEDARTNIHGDVRKWAFDAFLTAYRKGDVSRAKAREKVLEMAAKRDYHFSDRTLKRIINSTAA